MIYRHVTSKRKHDTHTIKIVHNSTQQTPEQTAWGRKTESLMNGGLITNLLLLLLCTLYIVKSKNVKRICPLLIHSNIIVTKLSIMRS